VLDDPEAALRRLKKLVDDLTKGTASIVTLMFALVRPEFCAPRGNRTPNPLIKRRITSSAVPTGVSARQVRA
jgi:hypothetical protein